MNLDVGKRLKCIEIISLALPGSNGPFLTMQYGFRRETLTYADFQRLFWDEWTAGLAFVGSR